MKKDWRNMSDKELDDFFKQQSEQPDIPFVPDDWEKMKQQLSPSSVNGALRPWYKRRGMWWGPLLLLLMIGGWMVWSHANLGNEPSGSIKNSFEEQVIEGKERGNDGVDVDKVNPVDRSGESGKSVSNSKKEGSLGGTYGAFKEDETLIAKVNLAKNTVREESERLSTEAVPSPLRDGVDIWTPVFGKLGGLENGELSYPLKTDDSLVPYEEKKKRQPEFWHDRRWSVAGLLSPDISALKWKDIHGVGTSVGINIEYFIHPKWSVNLGFLYAFKTYQGEEDYSAFGNYGTGKVGLKGDCYVFDVSNDVRYYAVNRELDRWYLSVGLSSYFMLREKYEMNYESSNGYPVHKELDIKNENSHLFSVVNLSVGYERNLSERLSLQVAPYYKVPWRGVGEGEVNLKSAGVLIGLKYGW
ncbi:hypothetical protein FKX85_13645 [Echinicola soli]|uniref:Outer membrane protein beta-barrel domain-containing protein n=1 Tax=Echinicola soli TaxID=2591634 RepID=A0A514CJM9_9BACT|nr:hypothetical protein [Echinicola soli]QDH80019.1 hypothetical protein FKX85_13645 [Echinicola soli]